MNSAVQRFSLKGSSALITGGTKGIGLAVAEDFLALGAKITIVSRTDKEVAEQIRRWTEKGFEAYGLAQDISKSAGRQESINFAVEKMGALSLLVNNVGTNIRKKVIDYSEDEYNFLIETNLSSVFDMCRKAYPHLCKSSNPAIVNVGSIAGAVSVPTGAPYAMTKAALVQLTKSLACEWASDAIRVNCVAPGFIKTPLTAGLLESQSFMQTMSKRIAIGRPGEADEVSALISFLCMPGASYITGETVAVDGGFLALGFKKD